MTEVDHEEYASTLLIALSNGPTANALLSFVPDSKKSRNAASSMVAIISRRIFLNTERHAVRKRASIYGWNDGIINCRNISDRDYLWTNLRRSIADQMHNMAKDQPLAYLFTCANLEGTTLYVWAIPETTLYDALTRLPPKEGGHEYTIQIRPDRNRIDRCDNSPDLSPYFKEFALDRHEIEVLSECRKLDAAVRLEGKQTNHDSDDGAKSRLRLSVLANRLDDAGEFDPSGIEDARERVLASIVRRRGQPVFRERLLAAYGGRCAITGCDIEAVLEASHIVPYMGSETNHPSNGLLLRADLHALFDLRLIAIDAENMTVLVSQELEASCYEEYQGKLLKIPDAGHQAPSKPALDQHRQFSGL